MDEIGSILREARETKGLTYEEVHEKLRISPKYLRALEESNYEHLPSATHVRGFLRKYTRLLGLDAEPLLARYEAVRIATPIPAPRPIPEELPAAPLPVLPPEPETGTFFNPLNSNVYPEQEESAWVGRLIIIALILCIGLLTWRFSPILFGVSVAELAPEDLSAAIQDVLSSANNEDPTSATIDTDIEIQATQPITTSELIVSTSRTSGAAASPSADSALSLPAPTPTRDPLPATLDIIELQIDITERSWLRVTIDGITQFEGQATRGETLNYTANESANVRTGNGVGVFVTINGIELGRLGERAQVVDRSWETTQ